MIWQARSLYLIMMRGLYHTITRITLVHHGRNVKRQESPELTANSLIIHVVKINTK